MFTREDCIPEISSIAFFKSLGPTDHTPSSTSHTPSLERVLNLCNSPLIWSGDTSEWNRDRWYLSSRRSRDECEGEGVRGESVRERRRWRVPSSCEMGSVTSRR